MSKKGKLASNFAMQATILAMASILSKLIGLVYNIPFANMLGNMGNGYYGAAQTVYSYILLLATFSIPAAVSKIMAERIQNGEYRNVKRIFNGALLYVLIVGAVAACFTYICAPYLVTENSVLSLRVLAPTIFLSGFLSVYRGYYQAYGNMVPTSVSQIVDQVFNAVFSIGAAYVFMKLATAKGYGEEAARYGAAGGTLGTGAGVVAGLIYMFFLFRRERKELQERVEMDETKQIMTYKEVFRLLLLIATPIIFSAAIYNINVPLDMTIFQKMSAGMDMGDEIVDGQYGLYSRMYLVLANVPIAMAAAVASAVIPGVSGAYASGNIDGCNRKITQSMQLAMTLTVPCAAGFAVLGEPIIRLLYPSLSTEDTHLVANLLLLGGISIVIYGISSVLNGVLQGIGKVNVPAVSAVIALVLHIGILVLCIGVFRLGIYSLIFATAFYAMVVVFVNYHYVKKELSFVVEWKQTAGVPIASAVVMGVVAFLVYRLLNWFCQLFTGVYTSNAVAVLVGIGAAILCYFVALIKFGGYTREMLLVFPKGEILARIAGKLHLLKE